MVWRDGESSEMVRIPVTCRFLRARIVISVMTGGLVDTAGFYPLTRKVTMLIECHKSGSADGFAPTLSKCAALSDIT